MEDEITPAINSNTHSNLNEPTVLPRFVDKNSPILDDRVAVLVAAPLSNTRTEDSYTQSRDDSERIADDISGSDSDDYTGATMTLTPGGGGVAANDPIETDNNPHVAFGYSPHSARRVAEALSSLVFSTPGANNSNSNASARPIANNYLTKSDVNHCAERC